MTKLGGTHGARRDSATAPLGRPMKQSSARGGRVAGSPLPPIYLPTLPRFGPIIPNREAYGIRYERPFVYGKLLCPNGHGQLVLAQLLLSKRYAWVCLQCDIIKPCKWQGGTRHHAKTTRRKK